MMEKYFEMDPLAVLLPSNIYPKWVEGHIPHTPKVADMERILKSASAAEKKAIAKRIKDVTAHADAINKVISIGQ